VAGVFPNFDKSVYAARAYPMRNAALTNIAPTGTISMICDVSGGRGLLLAARRRLVTDVACRG
jgi:ribonucleoside-diphosphate reductase alpha chain